MKKSKKYINYVNLSIDIGNFVMSEFLAKKVFCDIFNYTKSCHFLRK